MNSSGEITLFGNATVDAETNIALHLPKAAGGETVYILFGKENLTLEFYDVESLERLRDVASEGASRLKSMVDSDTSADQPQSDSHL